MARDLDTQIDVLEIGCGDIEKEAHYSGLLRSSVDLDFSHDLLSASISKRKNN